MKVVKKNSDGEGRESDMERIKQVGPSVTIWKYKNILQESNEALCFECFRAEY